MGEEFNDTNIMNRSRGVLAQLNFQKGSLLLKSEDFEGADAALDEAIKINANYAKAYYQKGLVAKNINGEDLETMLYWFDQAIMVGEQVNDQEVVRMSNSKAHAEFFSMELSLLNKINSKKQSNYSRIL